MGEAISTNSKIAIKWFILHTNFQWLKKKRLFRTWVPYSFQKKEKMQGHNTFEDGILDEYCKDNVNLIPLKTKALREMLKSE